MATTVVAVASWPDAPFTRSLVEAVLDSLRIPRINTSEAQAALEQGKKCIFWSTYDDIDHELVHLNPDRTVSSTYVIRKALIRKHFLATVIRMRCTKHPQSILQSAVPKTFGLEIAFADELDELFADDLWDLGQLLEGGKSWWILKPGMADRGNGIRMFNTRSQLDQIFESFEDTESDDENESQDATNVMTSQLRHFVIQEYIPNPLLIDPFEKENSSADFSSGRKFHLRAYVVASGGLSVYVLKHILALFSAVPYRQPEEPETDQLDLAPHLTNTSLQADHGEENVRLLHELIGHRIHSKPRDQDGPQNSQLTAQDVQSVVAQITSIMEETFKAAVDFPIHFQPLSNAFELYGVDFLISHEVSDDSTKLKVHLLEVNAEPAIELTGPRLSWILETLFKAIGTLHVEPFTEMNSNVSFKQDSWAQGEERNGLVKCCDIAIRGS